MNRIAIFVQQNPEYHNQKLIELARQKWNKEGIEFRQCYLSDLQSIQNSLKDTDEIIIYDDSFFGPVNDLKTLLAYSDGKDTDWWRLTGDSMFFGVRKHILDRIDLVKLLSDTGYADSAGKEFRLNKCLELFNTESIKNFTEVPLLDEPLFLAQQGCPFFKHELFHRDYDEVITTSLGHQAVLFYNWLKTNYPEWVEALWKFMLADFHHFDIYRNLHLSYILSTKNSDSEKALNYIRNHKLLLVMHLYYPDKFSESCSYAAQFPRETTVCITTSSEEKAEQLQKMFEPLGFSTLYVRTIENRGRDVSALLVGAADLLKNHDIICFFHDKKTLQTKPGSIGLGFADKLIENMFGTSSYILNIINLFADNAQLGLLSPPAPHHSDYYFTQGVNWGPNYQLTEDLARHLSMNVPISRDKAPIAPLGTCFWFRADAMKPLTDREWKYEDFPPEPNNVDGTLLHAIERIYPFAVCSAGYYPGYLMTDRWAKVEYSSLRYYVEGYNNVCFRHGILSYQKNMREEIARRIK